MTRHALRQRLMDEYGHLGRLVRQVDRPMTADELSDEFKDRIKDQFATIDEIERALNGDGETDE